MWTSIRTIDKATSDQLISHDHTLPFTPNACTFRYTWQEKWWTVPLLQLHQVGSPMKTSTKLQEHIRGWFALKWCAKPSVWCFSLTFETCSSLQSKSGSRPPSFCLQLQKISCRLLERLLPCDSDSSDHEVLREDLCKVHQGQNPCRSRLISTHFEGGSTEDAVSNLLPQLYPTCNILTAASGAYLLSSVQL